MKCSISSFPLLQLKKYTITFVIFSALLFKPKYTPMERGKEIYWANSENILNKFGVLPQGGSQKSRAPASPACQLSHSWSNRRNR